MGGWREWNVLYIRWMEEGRKGGREGRRKGRIVVE